MVVLHVAAPAAVGGLESVVRALSGCQRARGIDAHVAAVLEPGDDDHPFVAALRAAGIPIHVLGVPGRAYWRERQSVAALCRSVAPDVVHTHGYRPDVVDAGVARSLGIPVVTTVHGFTGGDWRNRLYEGLQRAALRGFDAVAAVSHGLAHRLRRAGVPAERLHVVPNAWWPPVEPMARGAARAFTKAPPAAFHIGWVGRMTAEKGPDVLVEALPHLQDLPVLVSFIGDGPARADVVARAAALGVGDRIRCLGTIADAARLFPAFDVFVLSSRTEGMPIALFEAMATNVPVVAAAVGGVPEVVCSLEARLVPPDDPVALAAAIKDVRADPRAAAARTRAAAERLTREFGAERWIERYAAVYARAGSRVGPAVATA
jgi:glycosyltransferase involved in cell wall biosynthesis